MQSEEDSVAYDLVKTTLSESEEEAKDSQFLIPDLVIEGFLDQKRLIRKRNRRKWNRSDFSHSDSVELMTLIFDF